MKILNGTVITLSILTIVGIVLIIIGNFVLTGDARYGFTYMGAGTAALACVLLVEIFRRRFDLNKAVIHRDQSV